MLNGLSAPNKRSKHCKESLELKHLLKQSPSLKSHFSQCFNESFAAALELVRAEYPDIPFPNIWQFNRDIDAMLSVDFWVDF